MVEVTNLSSDTDPESFRVSGLGAARLLVATCSLDSYPEIQTSDPIRALRSQLHDLRDEKDALEAEIAVLTGFGKKMASVPDATPGGANSFSSTLFEKTLSNTATVRELDAKIAELSRQIGRLGKKAGTSDVRAVVTIVADEAGTAQLKLAYREFSAQSFWGSVSTRFLPGVGGPRWSALYDLYAASQEGKPSTSVFLHYRVNLSQKTGEDWNDAKLILSTSETDILDAGVPASDSLVVEPKYKPPPPPPPQQMAIGSMRTKQTARKSTGFMDMEAEESISSDFVEEEYEMEIDGDSAESLAIFFTQEISEAGAAISKSPMAVNYTVDELTTIPSDAESHKVLVAIVPFEATISHITTPLKTPLAYLQVRLLPPLSLPLNLPLCGV